MNQCIKCNKEIPEGELFCMECSLNPGSTMFEEDKPSDRIPAPKGKMQTPQPVKYVRVQTPVPVPVKQKRSAAKPLAILLVLVTLLLIAVVGVVFWQYDEFRAEKNRLKAKDADLSLRQAEIDDLYVQIEALEILLEDTQQASEEKEHQIQALKAQLDTSQSDLSQEQYDLTVLQQEILQLQEENQDLTVLCDDLQKELEEQEAARNTLEAALEMARKYKTKSEFMDTYVVFVMNDDSGYYHTYDCEDFTYKGFWAYSRKVAETRGYEPCPNCGGKP